MRLREYPHENILKEVDSFSGEDDDKDSWFSSLDYITVTECFEKTMEIRVSR